jgi:hypothetical protein
MAVMHKHKPPAPAKSAARSALVEVPQPKLYSNCYKEFSGPYLSVQKSCDCCCLIFIDQAKGMRMVGVKCGVKTDEWSCALCCDFSLPYRWIGMS